MGCTHVERCRPGLEPGLGEWNRDLGGFGPVSLLVFSYDRRTEGILYQLPAIYTVLPACVFRYGS